MKALIQGERIAQIVADGDEFPVHSGLTWVECDETITDRHTYSNGAFVAPPPPPSPLTTDEIYDRLIDGQKMLKATVLTLVDEINILRVAAGLTPRTDAQAKNAILAKFDAL